jgi:hypothetical protein
MGLSIDRENVIKGLHYCTHTDGVECPNCPYWKDDDCVETLNADVLTILKEQEEEIENLKQTAQSMMEGICLLKEQNNCENCAVAIEDRQPVVKCEDCKHCYYASNRVPEEQTYVCDKIGIDVLPDWFCADGERKDGDGNELKAAKAEG